MPNTLIVLIREYPILASLVATLAVIVLLSCIALAARQLSPPSENLPLDEEEGLDWNHTIIDDETENSFESMHHVAIPVLRVSIPGFIDENAQNHIGLDPVALHRMIHSEASPVAMLRTTMLGWAGRRDNLALGEFATSPKDIS